VDKKIETALNKLGVKVSQDIENMKFNTPIASMMEFINLAYHERLTLEQKKTFLIILAPFAPHITEELWQWISGSVDQWISEADEPTHRRTDTPTNWSIHQQPWPESDKKYLEEEEYSIAVQVNGKVRDILLTQKDIISSKEVVEKMALESQKAQKFLAGKSVKKVVYIPGKVISFVVI
ncbi:MAG: class I tRNA ligase family protein, partial [Candidatus Daviesbacteria bacterium]|nr:class I tRNA ligase family protein [Candidatus Daviesbacteria bacterium]